jgi:hypothetical protein
VIGPAHTLLALLVVEAVIASAPLPARARYSSNNRAASVLRTHGVDVVRLRELATLRGAPEEPPAELLAPQLEWMRLGDPFDGAETIAALTRAMQLSLAHRHALTGTGHLLLALIENDAGEAATVLGDLGVDVPAVRERVEKDLRIEPAAW